MSYLPTGFQPQSFQSLTSTNLTTAIGWAGIFTGAIVAVIFSAIVVISNSNTCSGKSADKMIDRKTCCEGTWKNFGSSVPLTIFVASIVIIVMSSGMVYASRGSK